MFRMDAPSVKKQRANNNGLIIIGLTSLTSLFQVARFRHVAILFCSCITSTVWRRCRLGQQRQQYQDIQRHVRAELPAFAQAWMENSDSNDTSQQNVTPIMMCCKLIGRTCRANRWS